MHLKVTRSNLRDLVPVGATIALSNNGSTVRLLDVAHVDYFAEVESPEIHFHADDNKTSITLSGFVRQSIISASYTRITLDLE